MRSAFIILLFLCFLADAHAQSSIEKFIYNTESAQTSQLFFMREYAGGQGFAIVTTSSNTNVWRIQTRKFDAYGNEKWSKVITMLLPGSLTTVNVTASGGLLLGGIGYDDDGNNASLVIHIDADGKILWQNLYLPNGNSSGMYSVSEGKNGEILAYGFYSRLGGGSGGHFLLRLKADGNVVSLNSLYSSGLWGQGFPAKDGGLYIKSHEGAQKYNAKGKLQWIRSQPEGFTRSMYGGVDDDNNFYCFSGSGTTYILTKFSAAGKSLWHKKLDFIFSKFSVVNNRLIFINLATSKAYAFNTDGEFLESTKFNYTYESVARTATDRFWLAGRHNTADKSGMVLALTSSELKSACAAKTDTVYMTDGTYNFAPANVNITAMGYNVKAIQSLVNSSTSETDTLCADIKPLLVNLGNDTALCMAEVVELDAGHEGAEYLWNTGETTRKIKVTSSGTYKVMVKNALGETGEDSIKISFVAKPEIVWNFNRSNADPGEKILLLDEIPGGYDRLWILPNGDTSSQQKLEYVIPGNGEHKITLKLTNAAGCSNQISKTIKAAFYRLYLPNAFSPNNDELNEIFEPKGYGIIHYTLKVYNRWGELVFDGENKGWDGKFKNSVAAEGVYFYKADIYNVQQKHEYLSGNINLIK